MVSLPLIRKPGGHDVQAPVELQVLHPMQEGLSDEFNADEFHNRQEVKLFGVSQDKHPAVQARGRSKRSFERASSANLTAAVG